MLKLTVVAAVALLAVSCASSGTPARPDSGPHTATRDRAVITREEVASSSARDAYDAVRLLRPDWLRPRGASSFREADPEPAAVVVYVDGQRYGAATSLQQFPPGSFKEMRYYTASEATSLWGTGHGGGVISLTTK